MSNSYKCPHCGAFTAFDPLPIISKVKPSITRNNIYERIGLGNGYGDESVSVEDVAEVFAPDEAFVTRCQACRQLVFWANREIAYPIPKGIEAAEDMPEKAKEFFDEAQSIIALSPRAACALLRICLELLVNFAGENKPGFNKNRPLIDRINMLGASADILELLHTCRVAGNEFSHPGEINLENEDTPEIAENISELINALVGIWISPAILAGKIKDRIGKV